MSRGFDFRQEQINAILSILILIKIQETADFTGFHQVRREESSDYGPDEGGTIYSTADLRKIDTSLHIVTERCFPEPLTAAAASSHLQAMQLLGQLRKTQVYF